MARLNEDEQQLADKITDAGPEQDHADEWVARLLAKAWQRGYLAAADDEAEYSVNPNAAVTANPYEERT